ncbi:MAG: dienelactone hydrolase [Trueperaceae bacterium]|nr:dienelactone hydrolase [Trueperaceae bacterium]
MDLPAYVPGDALPGAPALAPRGPHPVGVTTLRLTNPYQIDVLGSLAGGEPVRATRELDAEVWYPARHAGTTRYLEHLEPTAHDADAAPRPFRFPGRAARDAEPARDLGPCPLVIVSHGYLGSRVHLSWLGENLASKGYAVLALDHTDSTYADRGDFLSTLRNRPLDLALAVRVAADLERRHPLLAHVWDTARTALVGFSMGGYGTLLALGAGLGEAAFADPFLADPLRRELVADLVAGDPFYDDLVDGVTSRVKAAVLLAPWGGERIWSDAALARVTTPLFLAAGSDDDIAEYRAIRRVFEGASSADRWLLTFEHARHNVGNNPPPDALATAGHDAWWRYADPVWDTRRIVNVLQHHLTAFLGSHLRGLPLDGYLEGALQAAPGTSWPGYPPRSTLGLRLERHEGERPSDTWPSEEHHGRDLTATVAAALAGLWRTQRAAARAQRGV